MLRSWVEQYFSDLVSEIPLCRREEGDGVYGDDDVVHLNLEMRCMGLPEKELMAPVERLTNRFHRGHQERCMGPWGSQPVLETPIPSAFLRSVVPVGTSRCHRVTANWVEKSVATFTPPNDRGAWRAVRNWSINDAFLSPNQKFQHCVPPGAT